MSGFFGAGGTVFPYILAFGKFNTAGALVAGSASANVATSRTSAGEYLLDYTAAGFTLVPVVVASVFANGGIRFVSTDALNATITNCTLFGWDSFFSLIDVSCTFMVIGT